MPVEYSRRPFSRFQKQTFITLSLKNKEICLQDPEALKQCRMFQLKLPKQKEISHSKLTRTHPAGSEILLLISKAKDFHYLSSSKARKPVPRTQPAKNKQKIPPQIPKPKPYFKNLKTSQKKKREKKKHRAHIEEPISILIPRIVISIVRREHLSVAWPAIGLENSRIRVRRQHSEPTGSATASSFIDFCTDGIEIREWIRVWWSRRRVRVRNEVERVEIESSHAGERMKERNPICSKISPVFPSSHLLSLSKYFYNNIP